MSENSKSPEGVANHVINVLHASTFEGDMLENKVEGHGGVSNTLVCSKKHQDNVQWDHVTKETCETELIKKTCGVREDVASGTTHEVHDT